MKKLLVVMLTVGFICVANAEAKWPKWPSSETKWPNTEASAAQEAGDKINQMILEEIKTKKQQANTKEEVELIGQKATKLLELLQLDNQKYKEDIGAVIKNHQNLLNANSGSNNESMLAEHFYLMQENVKTSVSELTKKDAALGKKVGEIVNHPYWVNCKGRAMTMHEIVLWAHQTFPFLPWTDEDLQ